MSYEPLFGRRGHVPSAGCGGRDATDQEIRRSPPARRRGKCWKRCPFPAAGSGPPTKNKQTNKQKRGGRRNIEISDGCCHGDARERQPSRNRCLRHMSSQFLSLFFRRVRVLFLLVFFFWFSLLVLFVCLFLLLLLLLLLMRDRRNRRTFVSAA